MHPRRCSFVEKPAVKTENTYVRKRTKRPVVGGFFAVEEEEGGLGAHEPVHARYRELEDARGVFLLFSEIFAS